MVKCHDCGVEEGEYHELGCDMEICIQCGDQKMFCRCKGKREIWIQKPIFCAKCGKKFPMFFIVSNEEWSYVCGITFDRKDVLCRNCFDLIKKMRDIYGKNM